MQGGKKLQQAPYIIPLDSNFLSAEELTGALQLFKLEGLVVIVRQREVQWQSCALLYTHWVPINRASKTTIYLQKTGIYASSDVTYLTAWTFHIQVKLATYFWMEEEYLYSKQPTFWQPFFCQKVKTQNIFFVDFARSFALYNFRWKHLKIAIVVYQHFWDAKAGWHTGQVASLSKGHKMFISRQFTVSNWPQKLGFALGEDAGEPMQTQWEHAHRRVPGPESNSQPFRCQAAALTAPASHRVVSEVSPIFYTCVMACFLTVRTLTGWRTLVEKVASGQRRPVDWNGN